MKSTTLFILCFAVLIAVLGAVFANNRIKVLGNSDIYSAVVVDCEKKQRRSSQRKNKRLVTSYAPIALSKEGYKAIGSIKVGSKSLCEGLIGHEVDILVNRDDPEKTSFNSFFHIWFIPFFLLGSIPFAWACAAKRVKLAVGLFCGFFMFGGTTAAIEFRVFQSPPENPNLQPINGAVALQACIDHAVRKENARTLSDLKSLTCKRRQIADLTTLRQLTSLEELDLTGNQILSLKTLGTLSELHLLTLDGNKTLRSLDGLQSLSKLETLRVHCAGLVEIDAVKDLNSLRHLDVSCNKFSSLSAVTNLDLLEKLIIDDNPNVTNILPIANKPELDVITMYQTPISDISPLFGNDKLSRANIGDAGNVPCHQISELRSRLVKSAQIRGPKECEGK